MGKHRICQCGEITKNKIRCDECESKRPVRQRRSERNNESSAKRGYDAAWKKLRLVVLADQPICELCEAQGIVSPAMEVHHVEPISARPDLRLERSNLMALCPPCHRDEDNRRRREERYGG